MPAQVASITLPVPSESLFAMPEDGHAAFRTTPTRVAVADSEEDRPKHAGRNYGSSKHAERGRGRARIAHVAPARRGAHTAPSTARPSSHAANAPKRSVRVAALKKR